MKKRILIKIAVLLPIFVLSLYFFHKTLDTSGDASASQMEAPTYPTVSFRLGKDLEANMLYGYKKPMDVASIRDTVTSTEGLHTLTAFIQPRENVIVSADYRILTLDGQEVMESGTLELGKETEEGIQLDFLFGDTWFDVDEGVLELTIGRADRDPLYFYTRLTKQAGEDTANCVKFAMSFSELTRNYENAEDVEAYLDLSTDADNGTYQRVTSECTVDQVMMRDVVVKNHSDFRIEVQETNETYTSLTLSYTMEAGIEGTMDTYDVEEYYRVRSGTNHYYLLNFERTMEVQYQNKSKYTNKQGLDLGVADPDVEYLISADNKNITFVQNDTLWYFNIHDNQLTRVFGYRRAEGADERDTLGPVDIQTISIDEKGNVCFLVTGYMAADLYEGQVGTMVCFYNADEKNVTTAAFIPSDKGAEVAIHEMSDMVYYSKDYHSLYLIRNNILYEINTTNGKVEELAKNLQDGRWASSVNNRLLAYYTSDKGAIRIVDLETNKEWSSTLPSDGSVYLLGFSDENLVYGIKDKMDSGVDILGESISPMNAVKIVDSSLKELKTYQNEGIYIVGGDVGDDIITINCVKKENGVYVATADDHITVHQEEDEEAPVALRTYINSIMERSVRFKITQTIHGKTSRKTAQLIRTGSGSPTVELEGVQKHMYYEYAKGTLRGVYDTAGEAISDADENVGIVTSSGGGVIWVRGNRDLNYRIETLMNGVTVTVNTVDPKGQEIDLDGDGKTDGFDMDGDGYIDEIDLDGDGTTDGYDIDGDGIIDEFKESYKDAMIGGEEDGADNGESGEAAAQAETQPEETEEVTASIDTVLTSAQIIADYMQVPVNIGAERQSGKTLMEALNEAAEANAAELLNLTGCEADQLCYLININCPVMIYTDTAHALVLIGYTETSFTYLDPNSGTAGVISTDELADRMAGGGNAALALYKSNYSR